MFIRIIIISLFITLGVNAQTLLVVTNVRDDVAGGPAFTLTGPVGSYRITYNVETTPGVPIDLNQGETFRLEVWASDNFRLYNLTNTLNPEVDASIGQVRFVIPSLGAGQYRVRGIVTPVSGDTNESWNLTHHFLTVTSTPAQAQTINITNEIGGVTFESNAIPITIVVTGAPSASLSLFPLIASNGSLGLVDFPWGQIHSVTGTFGTLNIGDLNVAGAVNAVDTGAVKLVGSTMTGGLTNEAGFFGDGIGLTNIPYAAISDPPGSGSGATQAIATVGGSTVTSAYDEATATLSWSNAAAGGLALWSEGTGTAHQIGTEWLPPGSVSGAGENFLGFTIYTNLAVSMRRANPFTAALGEGARDMQATWSSSLGINTTNQVALGTASTISGGFRNQAGGAGTTIGGGGNNSTPGQYQTIGGGDANSFTLSTASWGYIGGGANNLVAPASQYSAIMGGRQNTIESTGSGNYQTIGGGRQNAIAVDTVGYSVLMGGYLNRAGGGYAVIGGGVLNVVTGNQGVILGGRTNVVVGEFGMIPGGRSNRVAGAFGFAAGESAKVEHNGAFVWSSFPQLTASTATNEFVIGSERVRVNWAGGEVIITPTSIAMGGHTMTVVTNGDGHIFIGVIP
jgi:hypothetical protein